jgi:hypothetical protein
VYRVRFFEDRQSPGWHVDEKTWEGGAERIRMRRHSTGCVNEHRATWTEVSVRAGLRARCRSVRRRPTLVWSSLDVHTIMLYWVITVSLVSNPSAPPAQARAASVSTIVGKSTSHECLISAWPALSVQQYHPAQATYR